MPETKAPTPEQIDRAQEKAIRTLLDFLDHKRKIIRQPGGFEMVLMDIEDAARFLPDATWQFLRLFLIRCLERRQSRLLKAVERESSRLRDQIEAAESDATPQAEVNAAVRQILRDAGLD